MSQDIGVLKGKGPSQDIGALKGRAMSQGIGVLKGGNYVPGHWGWAEEIVFILAFVKIRRIETSIFLFLMG